MKILRRLYLATILTLHFINSNAASNNAAMVVAKNVTDIHVMVNNFCEYLAQLIICNGTDSVGINPSLGSGNCLFDPHYTHYDSLSTLNEVKFLEQLARFITQPA